MKTFERCTVYIPDINIWHSDLVYFKITIIENTNSPEENGMKNSSFETEEK